MLNLRELNVGKHDFSQYCIAATTGTLAAALAANAQLFYVRWASTTHLFVLHRFRAMFQALTPFTEAAPTDFGFELRRVTSVSAGGGGTDLGAQTKLRAKTSMAASQLDVAGAMRIATTGALTALTTVAAGALASSVAPRRNARALNITSVAAGSNPTWTTPAAHLLTVGTVIYITGVATATSANAKYWVVSEVATGTTFKIVAMDTGAVFDGGGGGTGGVAQVLASQSLDSVQAQPELVYAADTASDLHPVVLAQDEGLVLANRAVWPTLGTGLVLIDMAWSEVPR